ncbi:MAG: glycosyltransferase family 87 protein [Anaerolineaceae bacterium]
MLLKKTARYAIPFLITIAVVGLTFLNLRLSEQFKHQDEFAPRWVAARAWMRDGSSPYSDEVYQETQDLLSEQGFTAGDFSQGHFLDPVFYLYLYIPFSFLDYPVARAIWMTIIELSCIAGGWISLKLAGLKINALESILLILLVTLCYPTFKVILSASVLPLFIFLVLLACHSAMQGKSTTAGILLFLCIGMVPASVFVAIFFMIWRGSRRDNSLPPIYLAGVAFLLVSSLLLFPQWIPDWFANAISVHADFSWLDTPLMRVASFFPGAKDPIAIFLHVLVLFVMLVEWYGIVGKGQRQIQWKILLTLSLLYFVNPTASGAYFLFVWPGLFLFFSFIEEKWKISGKIIRWAILIALVYDYWTIFQNTQNWSEIEPTSVVVLLPALALIGLQWTRWWALDSPKPLMDHR